MDLLGVVHLASAVTALASGLAVLLARKGTSGHRRMGWVYASAMATVNVTALMIYDLFGGFGPFHIAAIVSGLTTIAGVIPAVRRKPRRMWIAHHAYWMTWSYVGLAAAAASEIATRYLRIGFGWSVALATFAIVGIGWYVIKTRVPKILLTFGIDVAKGSGSAEGEAPAAT